MNGLKFREIQFATDDYHLACELRQIVLRGPLGIQLTGADVAADPEQRHFGLFQDDGQLVACLSAVSQSGGIVKFRQMAVAETCRGSGCGRNLISKAEGIFRQAGFVIATLHARMTAVGFYQKLGYQCVSEEFQEVGIPHIQMSKTL